MRSLVESWRHLRIRGKAALLAFVAVLGGWSTVKEQAVEPLIGLYEGRQPHHDEELLRDLRAGSTFGHFRSVLGEDSEAVIAQGVPIDGFQPRQTVRDELFVLPTVYVEAFVDNDQTVVAFTVTLRSADDPVELEVLGRAGIRLGETTIADMDVGPAAVAGVCGAHMASYHEISSGSGAENFQVTAVGHTAAGAFPEGASEVCPPDVSDLEVDPVMDLDPEPVQFVTDVRIPTHAFLAGISDFRETTVINSVTVTGPSVPLLPAMISLHPDTVQSIERED